MGIADIRKLCFVFHRFHQFGGIGVLHYFYFIIQIVENTVIYNILIQQNSFICRDLLGIGVNLFVRFQYNLVVPAVNVKFFIQNFLVDKPVTFFFRHRRKRQHHRHMGDIAAPDIKEPGNIIKRSQDVDAGFFFRHFLPHPLQFVRRRFSCVGLFQHKHRILGKLWPFGPDDPHQIFRYADASLLVFGCFLIIFSVFGIDHPAVKAQAAMLGKILLHIFFHSGNPFFPHPVQGHRRSRQLALCLNKISSVCPESCLRLRNHSGSSGSGKSCDIFSGFKIISHIFRFMKIRGGHNIHIDLSLSHLCSERFYSLCCHFCSSFPVIFHRSYSTTFLKFIQCRNIEKNACFFFLSMVIYILFG